MPVLSRIKGAILAVIALMSLAVATQAQPKVTLFVGKSEVSGVVRDGRVYVPAEALLRAMGLSWRGTAEGGYDLEPGKGGGAAFRGTSLTLRLAGRTVSATAVRADGQTLVDARAVAEGLGGLYLYTPAVGVAQVTMSGGRISQRSIDKAVKKAEKQVKEDARRKVSTAPSWRGGSTSSGAAASESAEKDVKGTSKTPDDEPISVERVSYSTQETGLMKGSVILKNDAEVAIRNVFVYVTIEAPDDPKPSDAQYATGLGGGASLPSYVKPTTDDSLPTYGGTPPTTVSMSYPEMASGGAPAPKPAATPVPTTSAAEAAPQASPTPTPMHAVTTLPAIFVAEILPGQTTTVPFSWNNSKRVVQATPSVKTQHDKVAFTRKKEKTDEEAAAEGSEVKTDAKADGKDGKTDAKDGKNDAKDGKSDAKADGKDSKTDAKDTKTEPKDAKSDSKSAAGGGQPQAGGAQTSPSGK